MNIPATTTARTDTPFRRGIRANLFVATTALCASLLFAEVALRWLWPPIEPLQLGEVASFDASESVSYTPRTNHLGFREDELDTATLGDRTVRILFLGDSFTFGYGVPNGSDRFSDIIEERLNRELSGQYHVYNAAKAGTAPHSWVKFLRRLYPVYEPTYLFAVFSLRDGTPLCTSLRCHQAVIESIKSRYVSGFAYRHLALARLVSHALMLRDFSHYYAGVINDAYLGTDEQRARWRYEQDALLRLQKFSREHGLELHLVIFPLLYGLNGIYPFDDVEGEIARFAREARIPVYSLTSGFLGQAEETLWVSASDQHPNEKANRIAAETLLPYVKDVISGRQR